MSFKYFVLGMSFLSVAGAADLNLGGLKDGDVISKQVIDLEIYDLVEAKIAKEKVNFIDLKNKKKLVQSEAVLEFTVEAQADTCGQKLESVGFVRGPTFVAEDEKGTTKVSLNYSFKKPDPYSLDSFGCLGFGGGAKVKVPVKIEGSSLEGQLAMERFQFALGNYNDAGEKTEFKTVTAILKTDGKWEITIK